MGLVDELLELGMSPRQLEWEVPDRPFMGWEGYTPPLVFEIAGIPAAIVDPHNEALWLWQQAAGPAPVLHIDMHPDMKTGLVKVFAGSRLNGDFERYIRDKVGIGSFIPVAMYEGIVDISYHYDPYSPKYTFVYGNGIVVSKNRRLANKGLAESKRRVSTGTILRELRQHPMAPILDMDLDGLLSDEYPVEWEYKNRLDDTLELCELAPRPQLITIAKSQTPLSFVPQSSVDKIALDVVKGLSRVYNLRRISFS